jgi:hypothetical protein
MGEYGRIIGNMFYQSGWIFHDLAMASLVKPDNSAR